ncbi:uracil-DNA glycosylase family 4 [Bradyrhizobium sp. F1.4.3]|uniref:uracil-DNA glycosylase family protein n=1 Tax=Bradyrhizobium sp. F1.4.3 TaxID=3156356 RepID=UPI003394A236
MSPEQKWAALRQLAKKRRRDSIDGYCRLSDFHDGYYECYFVSPWTRSAHNVGADVMLLGQDWSSSDKLKKPRVSEQRKYGQSRGLRTNVNLCSLLQNMRLDFGETYATNLFPFIKKGPMNARIRDRDMDYCAREYAIPQIEIISPRIVVCLGKSAYEAICRSLNEECRLFKQAFQPEHCINHRGIEIYGLPHPGSWGIRNGGGIEAVHKKWWILGNRLTELQAR